MEFKIKGKVVELQFSFASLRFMEDFNMAGLDAIEDKPFKLIPILQDLLLGAVNHNPKHKFTIMDVQEALEEFMVDGSVTDLLEELMSELQKSNFFKSLQKSIKK